MKKKLAYLIIIGLIGSCSVLKKSNTIKENDKVTGLWTEHWGIDSIEPETDVHYVDTLKIDINSNGKISIVCINDSNYIYTNIKYSNSQFSFQMENREDPKEKFVVYYSLILTEENVFNGEIINSRKQKSSVKLKKHTAGASR